MFEVIDRRSDHQAGPLDETPEEYGRRMEARRRIRANLAKRKRIEAQAAALQARVDSIDAATIQARKEYAETTAPLQAELEEIDERSVDRIINREPSKPGDEARRRELIRLIGDAKAELDKRTPEPPQRRQWTLNETKYERDSYCRTVREIPTGRQFTQFEEVPISERDKLAVRIAELRREAIALGSENDLARNGSPREMAEVAAISQERRGIDWQIKEASKSLDLLDEDRNKYTPEAWSQMRRIQLQATVAIERLRKRQDELMAESNELRQRMIEEQE